MKIELSIVSRRPPWPAAVPILVAVWGAMGLSAIHFARQVGGDAGLCLFKRLTGVPCPTCGFTRGMFRLAAGDVAGAFAMNPLLFVFLLAVAAVVILRVIFGRRLRVHLARRARAAFWILAAGAFAANWVYVILFIH